jgi:hypothetical protein
MKVVVEKKERNKALRLTLHMGPRGDVHQGNLTHEKTKDGVVRLVWARG